MANSWHVITSEYPPQTGGVSDYTNSVAAGLAAQGDQVHVWCPSFGGAKPGSETQSDGVVVHREPGAFTVAGLRNLGRQLNQFPSPQRILVQWVPHGYGYRSMNVAFCYWLWRRSSNNLSRVEIMVHEPYLPFRSGNWRQNAAAAVHRLMTILILRAAAKVWVSIPYWEQRLRPYAFGRQLGFQWLPVPSSIPVVDDPQAAQAVRQQYARGDKLLIGHFGTYGAPIVSVLEPIILAISKEPAAFTLLLMGKDSEKYRESLLRKDSGLARMIQATGALSTEKISSVIAACDLLIQPFPDGVSTRRTTVMAGLSHGKPIITTQGVLTEPFWKETGALALAPAEDVIAFTGLLRQLQNDASMRSSLGRAARALYLERFDPAYTVAALRDTPIEDFRRAS